VENKAEESKKIRPTHPFLFLVLTRSGSHKKRPKTMYRFHSESLKLAVVKLYVESTLSVRDIARLFCIGGQSIYRWVKTYCSPASSSSSSSVLRCPIARGRPQKLTSFAQKEILRLITIRKTINWPKLAHLLDRKFNIFVHRSTIYRLLARNSISYKKAHFRGKRPDSSKMCIFQNAIERVSQSSIVSLDEASFDTHIAPLYGWSRKGSKCFMYPRKSRRARKRYSLLLAICDERVLAWQLVLGSYNKHRFLAFLSQNLLPRMIDFPQVRHLLMDNVPFHHSKEVVQLLTYNKLPAPIFNPPYYPDTNPVEMVFSLIKANARRVQPSSLVEQVVRESISKDLSSHVLKKMFVHALSFPISDGFHPEAVQPSLCSLK